MTDSSLTAPVAEIMARLNIPLSRYTTSTRIYVQTFAQHIQAGKYVDVKFGDRPFSNVMGLNGTPPPEMPTMTVWHCHTGLTFGFFDGGIALLEQEGDVEAHVVLPPKGAFLPYDAFVAAWPEHPSQYKLRSFLAKALGMQMTALAA